MAEDTTTSILLDAILSLIAIQERALQALNKTIDRVAELEASLKQATGGSTDG